MSHKKGLLLYLHYHQPAFLEATGYLLDNSSRPGTVQLLTYYHASEINYENYKLKTPMNNHI